MKLEDGRKKEYKLAREKHSGRLFFISKTSIYANMVTVRNLNGFYDGTRDKDLFKGVTKLDKALYGEEQ